MSLDDETPTQYFGPDGRNWVHPVTGKMIRLSPTDYDRAEQRKAEWFAGQENKDHRSGCPIERTGRCSCDYLAQWDDDAEATHNNTVQFNADGTVALVDRHLQAPEIRYGEPFADEAIPDNGILFLPEYLRNNLGDLGKSVTSLNPTKLASTHFTVDADGIHPSPGITPIGMDGEPLTGERYADLFTTDDHGLIARGKLGTDVDGNHLTFPTSDAAARQAERADAWRSTAYLMLGTLVCILLGVIGREFGWY